MGFCHFVDISDPNNPNSQIIGRWSSDEQDLFMEGIFLFGNDWKNIADLIKSRTLAQVSIFKYGEV